MTKTPSPEKDCNKCFYRDLSDQTFSKRLKQAKQEGIKQGKAQAEQEQAVYWNNKCHQNFNAGQIAEQNRILKIIDTMYRNSECNDVEYPISLLRILISKIQQESIK